MKKDQLISLARGISAKTNPGVYLDSTTKQTISIPRYVICITSLLANIQSLERVKFLSILQEVESGEVIEI